MHFEPGDLLLFYGCDLSSRVIEWATRGPSHVGIVCPHDFGGLKKGTGTAVGRQSANADVPSRGASPPFQPGVLGEERRETPGPHPGPLPEGEGEGLVLFESTTLCDLPCVLTGRAAQGVQAHDPEERIASYHGAVARLRLTRAWRLSRHEIALLHEWLMGVASEPYDLRGALISGTRLFKWSALMPYPDLESLFCSELCAAALMRLHRMPLENPSVFNPASLVREVRRCGTYGAPRFVKRSEERREKSEFVGERGA